MGDIAHYNGEEDNRRKEELGDQRSVWWALRDGDGIEGSLRRHAVKYIGLSRECWRLTVEMHAVDAAFQAQGRSWFAVLVLLLLLYARDRFIP